MRSLNIAILTFGVLIFTSCSTKVEINAKWKEIPVIYGLLNPADSIQYIKINKAFLGNGNALTYAQQDSTNYGSHLLAFLYEKDIYGTAISTIQLRADSSILKDPGTFSSPKQILYRTPSGTVIHKNSIYYFEVRNSETQTTASSSTTIVNDVNVSSPYPGTHINFLSPQPNNFKVKWTSALNGKLYNLVIRFHYIEYSPSDTLFKQIDWDFGNVESLSLAGGEEMQQSIGPDDFYKFVASRLTPNLPLGTYRKVNSSTLDFIWTVGGMDLSTYIAVNRPSLSIVQDRPEFTNIEGGYGIFSSRNRTSLTGFALNPLTIDTLIAGQYTYNLGFIP